MYAVPHIATCLIQRSGALLFAICAPTMQPLAEKAVEAVIDDCQYSTKALTAKSGNSNTAVGGA